MLPYLTIVFFAIVEGESSGDVQFETDRARFLGRGQTIRSPAAIAEGWPLSNSSGAVLDPVFGLRRIVQIPRGQTVTIAFWTMAAPSCFVSTFRRNLENELPADTEQCPPRALAADSAIASRRLRAAPGRRRAN